VSTETLLDTALRYAAAGYRVVPIHQLVNGRCTCGGSACKTPGKHPLPTHGASDASNQEHVIRAWWRRWPNANIGLTLEGLVAVDVDPRNGGDVDEWRAKLPETCNAQTGGGGAHFLFKASNGAHYNGNGKFGPGVDLKHGRNQYIIVEPSVHASGNRYVWLDESEPWAVQPAPAPELLAEKPRTSSSPGHGNASVDAETVRDLRSALTALRADDYHQWIQIGLALKELGDQGRALWLEWSQTSSKYDPEASARKWESFDPKDITHKSVFAAAEKCGWVNPKAKPNEPAHEEAPQGRIAIRRAFEVAHKPQYAEWLMRPYLERNVLALMFGEFGTLKSFTALEFALTIASGQPSRALPEAKVHGGNVIYISAEGKGMWRRLKGWSIARGINLEDCKLWVIEHPVDLYSQQSLLELAEKINALGITPVLIVIDTLSRNCGAADENKTADMTAFLNGLDKMLRVPLRCTVLLVHHVGHMEKGRARGAYVLQGNTDANYLIERPDANRMLIELKTGRLKDSESPPPVCMEARVVELGSVDEDGRPETTLVLVSSSERPKQARRAPTGKNQVRAFEAIRVALAGGQTLLQAEAVRLVQKACEMAQKRAWEAVNGLLEGGFVVKGPMGSIEIPKAGS
jgi:hypothetical protein